MRRLALVLFAVLLGIAQAHAEQCDAPYSLSSLDIAASPGAVLASDFDADGNIDLVVFTSDVQSEMIFFKGNGDGTFTKSAERLTGTGAGLRSGAVADFNNDGLLDIVVNGRSRATVVMNRGGGKFVLGGYLPMVNKDGVTPTYVFSVAATDVDGDHQPDVVASTFDGALGVFLGRADGTFRTLPSRSTASDAEDIALGDLDGDGNTDLIVSMNQREVLYLLGNGDGTFGLVQFVDAGYAAWVTPVDIDRDGDLDMIVGNRWDPTVTILLNEPGHSPRFRKSAVINAFHVDTAVAGIVAWNFARPGAGRLAVLTWMGFGFIKQNADGSFATDQTIDFNCGDGATMASGDFDNDGDLDFVAGGWRYKVMTIVRTCSTAPRRRAVSPHRH